VKPVEAGVALRWQVDAFAATGPDVVRVVRDGECTLLLMANAFESAFSTCWPAGSRLILNLFESAWGYAEGDTERRLLEAYKAAAYAFAERADSLIGPEPDVADTPACVLTVAAIEESGVTFAWIGGDVGLLVRSHEIVGMTSPHTLRERYRSEHPGDLAVANVPNVLTRLIGARESGDLESRFVAAQAGDLVVLRSNPFQGPDVLAEDVVACLQQGAVADMAESLANRPCTGKKPAFVAAAVARVGGVH